MDVAFHFRQFGDITSHSYLLCSFGDELLPLVLVDQLQPIADDFDSLLLQTK